MKFRGILALMALFSAGSAAAQQQVVKLDVDKAIEIALDDNPTIKVAELEIERQKYVKRETIGNHLPSFEVSGAYNKTITRTFMDFELGPTPIKVSFEPDQTIVGTAKLTVPLVIPSVYQALKLNEQQMYAAVEAARGSRLTMINEVRKMFHNILVAEQSLEVLRSSESNMKQLADQLASMHSNGLASEYDMLSAQVQLNKLEPNIMQVENSIDVMKLMLKMYLGLPADTQVELVGTLDGYARQLDVSSERLTTDVSQNNDLKALEIQGKVLERQLGVMRTQRMPMLAGASTFQIMGRSGMGGKPNSQFEWQRPFSAGLQLSIPIFAGFTRVSRENQLKNTISQVNVQRDYLEGMTQVQVKSAINNILTTKAQMQANFKNIAVSQKAYDIAKARYTAGSGTMLELNTSELQMTQAKLTYTQSVCDYLNAQADYEKLIGRETRD